LTKFSFKSDEPFVSFCDRFHVSGKADVFGWRQHEHRRRVPDLSAFDVSWSVESGKAAFARYEDSLLDMGGAVSPRLSGFREYWQDAKGFMWRYDSDAIAIVFMAPPAPGFETFFMGIVAAEMGVEVSTPNISFAEREDAPSPSCRAFLDDGEPAFFGHSSDDYPIFRPVKR
jgi:hypothetical protein